MATSNDKTEQMQRFGAELRRRRLDANYKRAGDFADAIGVSGGYLSNLEKAYVKGERPPAVPSVEVIEKISEVLNWPRLEILQLLGVVTDEDLQEIPNMGLGAYIDPSKSRFLDTLEDFQAFFWWVDPEESAMWYYRQNKEKEKALQESTNNTKS